jgi:hypothetical protein
VASVLLASGIGCSAIIGLSDYEGDADTGGGANGGSAGKGTGGKGSGGASGSSGSGGSAGVAGTGGSSGSGGGSGNGGTGPTGCDGTTQFAPDDAVVASCVLRTSCDPFTVFPISYCVSNNAQLAMSDTCTSTALDCSDVEICLGRGYLPAGQGECRSNTSSCDPDFPLAYTCGDPNAGEASYYQNCNSFRGSCTTYADPADPNRVVADCAVTGATCSAGDTGSYCMPDGDTWYVCSEGVGYGISCKSLTGGPCRDAVGGSAACEFSSVSCTAESTRCDGDTLVSCDGSSLNRFDCGSVGLQCASDGVTASCVAPGCTVSDVETCTESCDGETLVFCYGGTPYPFDCSTIDPAMTCVLRQNFSGSSSYVACE